MDFLTSERGAVTVDWVVLTAALVGLGLAVAGIVFPGVQDLSVDVEDQLKTTIIETSFDPTPSSYLPSLAVYGGGCNMFNGIQRCGTTGFQRTDVTMSNGDVYQVETTTVYNSSLDPTRFDKITRWLDGNGDEIAQVDWPEADGDIYVPGFGSWEGTEPNPET